MVITSWDGGETVNMLLCMGLISFLLQVPAFAATYQMKWTQEQCEEVARWELWGSRGGQQMQQITSVGATTILCAMTPEISTTFEWAPRRGQWSLRLRAVSSDGETADSDPLAITVPLPRPRLIEVRR